MYDCGVREKTVLEELESLDLDQHDRDRIVKKYRDEIGRASCRERVLIQV